MLVIKDRLLTKIAKRNMKNIVPLLYELRKAKGGFLNWKSMYEGMIHAYTGGNIGAISNKISVVWNSGAIGKEQINVVAWLTFQNNAVIDYAKTLWLPEPPTEIDKIIKKYTKSKLPNFFIYAKDKKSTQVEVPNDSAMNRFASRFPDMRIKFAETVSDFDYHMLLSNKDFELTKESYLVIASYDYWQKRQNMFNTKDENHSNQEDLYMYQRIREKIIEDNSEYSIDFIIDSLVTYLYTMRKDSIKKILWSCFGKEIVNNLQKNLIGQGRVCKICGKRFQPNVDNQLCCSKECSVKLNVQKQRERDMNKKS